MKSVYSYISIYVRSLEKERDELLNRLLEANRIRPLSPARAGEAPSVLMDSSLIVHPCLLPRSVARVRGEPGAKPQLP